MRRWISQTLITAGDAVINRWDDINTPEGRREVLCDVLREGVQRNYQALVDSDEWYIYIALEVTSARPGPRWR